MQFIEREAAVDFDAAPDRGLTAEQGDLEDQLFGEIQPSRLGMLGAYRATGLRGMVT
jgi:hypothetical protein